MEGETSGLMKLDLVKLGQMDGGRLNICFQQELQRVVADIENRPVDKRPREIIIKITLTPDANDSDGLLDGVKAKTQMTNKIPTYKTKEYDFGVRNGNLMYSEINPTNHRERALPGMIDDDYAGDED